MVWPLPEGLQVHPRREAGEAMTAAIVVFLIAALVGLAAYLLRGEAKSEAKR